MAATKRLEMKVGIGILFGVACSENAESLTFSRLAQSAESNMGIIQTQRKQGPDLQGSDVQDAGVWRPRKVEWWVSGASSLEDSG